MNDDEQVGRLLSRREALSLFGAAGLWLVSRDPLRGHQGPVAQSCVVRPEQTEGPYFVDERLNRSDIRADSAGTPKPGLPLTVEFNVTRIAANSCVPLAGAMVDLWHCDAMGIYSDVEDPGFNTRGERWLRGYQVTDRNGLARFSTVYPGWYRGRTVHIHFKIRSPAGVSPGYEFTSQLYFDDTLTDRVHALPPYNARGQRSQRNRDDGIFRRDGAQLMLPVAPAGEGYRGVFDVSLQVG